MPFCAYCGGEVVAGVAVCPHCGHPQGGVPSGAYAPGPPKQTEGMAIASLALGVGGLVACPVIASIIGIVLGIVARGRIKRSGGTKGGDGLAIGGIVTGAVGMAIVPILIAIAIPTFLGARERAQDRVAEAALHESLASFDQVVNGGSVPPTTTLTFVEDGESAAPGTVSYILEGTVLRLAVRSDSGKCLAARHDGVGDVAFALLDDAATCRASIFDPAAFTFPALPLGQP